MATITTRAGKGSPLTNTEVDANFTNLNTAKLELGGGALTGAVTTTSTIDGRDVSVDGTKLDTVATSANNYTHPSNHAISVITGLQTALDGKIDDSQVLTNVPSGALFTDTNTTYSVGDNGLTQRNFTNTFKSKLEGIEASATADQTAAQILTAIKTVDGSGSGLDADTVDGIHSSDIVETSNGNSGNLDTEYTAGMFGWATTTTGRPENYGQGINIVSGGKTHNNTNNWITQLGFGTAENTAYFRSKTNAGSWGSWYTLWHSGNLTATNKANYDTAYGWGDHGTQSYATQSYVGTQISNLVDSSPAALNTLNELAAALGDDANFSTTVTNSIATKLPLAGGVLTGNLSITVGNEAPAGANSSATGLLMRGNYNSNTWAHKFHKYDHSGGVPFYLSETVGSGSWAAVQRWGTYTGDSYKSRIFGSLKVDGVITASTGDSTNWNTAYGWGNHASAGYTNDQTPAELLTAIKTVDGSGSGLDADLLDGQQGSYYAPAATTIATASQAHMVTGNAFSVSAAPDTVLEYQQASGQTDTKLSPSTDWYNSIRMGHGDPYSYYSNTIAVRMTGTNAGTMYTQLISSNTAAGWRTQWDSTIDGSGSGLDADLLDGNHASAFMMAGAAPNTHTHSYLPLAGGTLTGGLTGTTADFSGKVDFQGTAAIEGGTTASGYGLFKGYSANYNHFMASRGVVTGSTASPTLSGGHQMTFVEYVANAADGFRFKSSNTGTYAEIAYINRVGISTIGTVTATGGNSGQWNTAYGWGNHASGGYLTAETLSSTNNGISVTGTKYFTQSGTVSSPLSGGGNASLQVYSVGGNYAAYMAFHRSGHYAINWGMDTSNNMILGGWSASSSVPRMEIITSTGMISSAGQGSLWGASNDGSGSGLDADTVDGIQGASFLRSDANDTATGNLSFNGQLYFNSNSTGNYTEGGRFNQSTSGWGGMSIGGIRNSINGISQGWWFARNPSGQLVMAYQTSGNAAGLMLPTSGYNLQFRSQNVWNAGNDGSGSGLDADTLDGKQLAAIVPYHSGSDFANGTLVTTNIPSTAASGASFVIEVTGKSYSAAPPHSVIAQGYLYSSTIINYQAGTNIAGSNFTEMKAMSNGGYLSFWWPRHGYWNSYSVIVRDGGGSSDNRVTAIANSVDPSGATKKVTIPLHKSWNEYNDGASSGLDADLLDGQHGSYYLPTTAKAADSNLFDGIDSNRFIYGTNTAKITRWDGDWNTMFSAHNTAFIDNASGTNGNPDGFTHHHGYQVRHDNMGNQWGYQMMSSYHPTYPNVYHRSVNAGTWNAWKKMWDSGNDGSGSTLDADLLDGQHGSYYSAAHSHPYLGTTAKAADSELLDGLDLHTGRNDHANKVVRTNGSGYIDAGWINTTSGDSGLANDIVRIYCSNDSYLRYLGKSDFKVLVGLAKTTYDRRDYNSTTHYHTGANGHGATDWNTLLERGCGFNDSWSGANRPPGGTHFNGFTATHYSSSATYHHGMQMAMDAGNPSLTWLRGWWANGGSGNAWQKIWTSGNDGAGSGLDANLFDGNGTGHFWNQASVGLVGATRISSASNFNNSLPSGWYQYSGATNAPGSSWYNMMNVRHSNTGNDHGFQIAMSYYDNNFWSRSYQGGTGANNGSYQAWAKSWTTVNDGSGSGLDADTVDGIQAASFWQQSGSWVGDLGSNGFTRHSGLSMAGGSEFVCLSKGGQGYTLVDGSYLSYEAGGFYTSYNSAYGNLCGFKSTAANAVLFTQLDGGTVDVTASGNITAYSDERLKENIKTLDGSKVLQMRGVSFTKDGEEGSGVIAQELEKVAPELVYDGEYKSVAYGNITGYLIEAIKDQQKEINELKTLVEQLLEK